MEETHRSKMQTTEDSCFSNMQQPKRLNNIMHERHPADEEIQSKIDSELVSILKEEYHQVKRQESNNANKHATKKPGKLIEK